LALIDLYNKSIFSNLRTKEQIKKSNTNPVAVQLSSAVVSDTVLRGMAKSQYESASKIAVASNSIISIRPDSLASEYSNRLEYSLTRAKSFSRWIISPEGLRFSLQQGILQAMNPQIESKIWNPLSVFSNLIPFVGYHERRHFTTSTISTYLANKVGNIPSTYSEAVYFSDKKSRILYQSPYWAVGDDKKGINFVNEAQKVMAQDSTWKGLNPNRYNFPIGADGAGLPMSNLIAPREEMQNNINFVSNGFRYTKSFGFNPYTDGQVTVTKQIAGTSFTQTLLKSIPFVNTLLTLFGYGIAGANSTKIKIYNPYNPTYPYYNENKIRIIGSDGELLSVYELSEPKTPIEQVLYAVEQATTKGNQDVKGTFSKQRYVNYSDDIRTRLNPQDNSIKSYLQTYGDIIDRRTTDKTGTAQIDRNTKKPYSKYVAENTKAKLITKHYGLALSGAKSANDRKGDLINLIPYGEDVDKSKELSDFIPFKFYHINKKKWIVFRATPKSIRDDITPNWNELEYIGRADSLHVYKNTKRSISFSFDVIIHSPQEMKPVYEKVNALMGLCYPVYRKLSSNMGDYMEAPFIKLTIGDLFTDVYGILSGGISVSFPDDSTWEIRDSDFNNNKIAKVPRHMEISVTSFIPYSLDNLPISSTSPFYSAIKKWRS